MSRVENSKEERWQEAMDWVNEKIANHSWRAS